jgi:hypothetical protein
VNKANANEHKGSLKHTCPMNHLILRIKSKIKKRDSHSPKESKVQTNKTLHSFYDGTLSTKKKRFVFQQKPIPIEISHKSML